MFRLSFCSSRSPEKSCRNFWCHALGYASEVLPALFLSNWPRVFSLAGWLFMGWACTAGMVFPSVLAAQFLPSQPQQNRDSMFDMMKIMGKLGELKTRVAEAQASIGNLRAQGEAGAGMVKATVTGNKKLVELEIDPSLLNPSESVMLTDLVIAAVNQAQIHAEELARAEMKKNTEGILPPIPGLDLSSLGL
jgi:DNA-binding YbaB/EbfC family protein